MTDPETVRQHLREYFATATDEEILEDTLNYAPGLIGCSPEKARAILARNRRRKQRRERLRGWASSLTRSVQRLLS